MIEGVDVPYNDKENLDCLHEKIYGKLTVGDVARHV